MADHADDTMRKLQERDAHLRRVREQREADERRELERTRRGRGGEPSSLATVLPFRSPERTSAEESYEAVQRRVAERNAASAAFVAKDRADQLEALLRRRMVRDIPDATREDLYNLDLLSTPALEAAREWWESGDWMHLLLCGPKGVGKTLALSWLGREYLRVHPGRRVCFMHVSQLPGAVMFNDPKAPQLAPFILIDDVGREMQNTELIGECLILLSERADTKVAMTTNCSRRQRVQREDGSEVSIFEARYGDRLASKWNGRVRAVDVLGEDLRGNRGGF